jgi:SAM-dependent methyltransferase
VSWSGANLRHVLSMLKRPRNPAAAVYDSLGADLFLALAPGWLNLGLWEGPGDAAEAPAAARRLVATLARELPRDDILLDVGNGLGAQDAVIAEVARPRLLAALNITESQLVAGASYLRAAGARPVMGDAARLPLADSSVGGVISVEAAFHFSSRARFFAEVKRVLAPGGVLTMSDISAQSTPRRPSELVAGATALRFWGLRRGAAMTAQAIVAAARGVGLRDVTIARCGERVFDPAIRFLRSRLNDAPGAPRLQRAAAARMLAQWETLRRAGVLEYILLRAVAPHERDDHTKRSSAPSSSSTRRAHVGQYQRASSGVPQDSWRGGSASSERRAPHWASIRRAPASSRPGAVSS